MLGQGKPSGLVKVTLPMTTLQEKDEYNGSKSFEVVWLGKAYPSWALRSERVHNISCDDQGITTYDVWEHLAVHLPSSFGYSSAALSSSDLNNGMKS